MSHYNQLGFIEIVADFIRGDCEGGSLIEMGSYDVNGSIRNIFSGAKHTGVDLCEGPGVDLVMSGHEVSLPDGSFELAISCESFEHNPFWKETFRNMLRMTKPGGWVVFTCASKGRPEHGTTRTTPNSSPGTKTVGWDYYKNLTRRDFERLGLHDQFDDFVFISNQASFDLYFIGQKKGGDRRNLAEVVTLVSGRDSISKAHGRYAWVTKKKSIARGTLRLIASVLPSRPFNYVSSLLRGLYRTNRDIG